MPADIDGSARSRASVLSDVPVPSLSLRPRSLYTAMSGALALLTVLWARRAATASAQQCTPPRAPASAPRPFCSVPPYVSQEARAFLATTHPLPIDVSSPPAVAASRAAFTKAKLEPAAAVNAEFFSALKNESLGPSRVPALLATPKSFEPGTPAAEKLLMYLPGGAYVLGACELQLPVVAVPAHTAGLRVRCVQYRLAPEHPFPAGLDDAAAAYRAALESGLQPGDIALLGDSAGGGLALALLLKLHELGLPQPAAVVLYSPWSELTKSGDSHATLAGVDPKLHYETNLMAPALAYVAGDASKLSDPLVSPLRADYSKAAAGELPPILIQVGLRDSFVSDAVRLYRKLKAAGQHVEFEPWVSPGLLGAEERGAGRGSSRVGARRWWSQAMQPRSPS
jgi:monoterpene epsilon-lactone hydrolase